MGYDLRHFVNRQAEIDLFQQLLAGDGQRILLLHGPEGIGKSCVLHRLRRDCADPNTLAVIVDFRDDDTLTEAERVLAVLRENIGGVFASYLADEEKKLFQDFALASAQLMSRSAEVFARTLAAAGGSAGNGTTFAGDTTIIQGDVVGGSKVVIQNPSFVFNPGAGLDFARTESETRRNTAFRTALAQLVAERRVILFFDHFEEATEAVAHWIRHHVLDMHLDEVAGFGNLWVLIAGRKVPLQNQIEQWQHVVHFQPIEPLLEDAIRLFWIENRRLDPAAVAEALRETGGHPLLLSWYASDYEQAYRRVPEVG